MRFRRAADLATLCFESSERGRVSLLRRDSEKGWRYWTYVRHDGRQNYCRQKPVKCILHVHVSAHNAIGWSMVATEHADEAPRLRCRRRLRVWTSSDSARFCCGANRSHATVTFTAVDTGIELAVDHGGGIKPVPRFTLVHRRLRAIAIKALCAGLSPTCRAVAPVKRMTSTGLPTARTKIRTLSGVITGRRRGGARRRTQAPRRRRRRDDDASPGSRPRQLGRTDVSEQQVSC